MEKGIYYDAAYDCVQHLSFQAVEKRIHLRELLTRRSVASTIGIPEAMLSIAAWLGKERLDACFDAYEYVRPGIAHLFRDE